MSETTERPDKAARRQEILDAAFEEFTEKGYAGASMLAIARRARASKETLYAWFGDKETLLNTLLVARLGQMSSRAGAAAMVDLSPANVLPVIAEDTLRFMLTMSPLSQAIGGGEASERVLRLMGETIGEERQRFVDYLLGCRARGQIAFDDDPFELASLFVAMSEGEWELLLGTGMIAELTDEMIVDHAHRVTRLFLKGLAPEKPAA